MASKHFTISRKRLSIALAIAIPVGLGLGAAISHATWEPPTVPELCFTARPDGDVAVTYGAYETGLEIEV